MQDSTAQEIETNVTPEAASIDPLDQIDALFNSLETGSPAGGDGGDTEQPEPETADAEQPEKAAIDYSAEVPMADGSKVKLGELKDYWQQQQQHVADLIERENQTLVQQEHAELLLSYVQDLPPHVRQAALQQAQEDYTSGLQRLQSMIPETKTDAGMIRVKESIHGLVSEYGVNPRWADKITDPVAIKMLHDYARLKASIKAAKDNVKPLRSDAPKGKRPGAEDATAAAVQRAKLSNSQDDKLAAIDKLLRG